MRVTELTVQHVRTHARLAVQFNTNVTLITGKNGSGKTTLLEAVYISLRGRSFKDADDAILGRGRDWYRIDLATTSGGRKTVYDVRTERKKKTHTIDGKNHTRLPDKLKYPVILFEPEDMQMITGSPARRRRFMDTIITQYYPGYSSILSRYERALLQRNKLLKQPGHTTDELFAWNVALSRYGAEIVAARQEMVAYLDRTLTDTYRTIAPTEDTIGLQYSRTTPLTSQHLLTELEHSYDRDKLLGTTAVGPHRHDIAVTFNGVPANQSGSRGELRTITLALKFIEAMLVTERTGRQPIILLDDVFSELDESRQQRLLGEFHDNQVIMTSTSAVKIATTSKIIKLP